MVSIFVFYLTIKSPACGSTPGFNGSLIRFRLINYISFIRSQRNPFSNYFAKAMYVYC